MVIPHGMCGIGSADCKGDRHCIDFNEKEWSGAEWDLKRGLQGKRRRRLKWRPRTGTEVDVENDGAEIQGSKPERMVGTTTRRGRSRQPPHATAGHRPAPRFSYRLSAGLHGMMTVMEMAIF